VALHPNSAGVYYSMICVYAKQNSKEEAVSSLKQSVDKGFKDWFLIREDPDLKNIRNTKY
jgi:hypothetical protein